MHLKELDANLVVVLDALLIDASVTKAAERLGRSPSAVSHALANLRHIFDDQLFVRAGQRLTPTTRAKELAPTIHIIVSGLESLLRPSTPFDPTTIERKFLIECPPLAELYLLQPLTKQLAGLAPNISIQRNSNQMGPMLEELRNGRCEFVLMEGPYDQDVADISWQLLKEETFVTFTNKKNKWANQKLDLKTVRSLTHFVSYQGWQRPSIIEVALMKLKINPELIKPVSSSLTALLLSLETESLVTIPHHHAKTVQQHMPIERVALPKSLPSIEMHLGWHKSFERDECHQWLRQQIHTSFKA